MIFGKHINEYYKKYWYLFLMVVLCDVVVDICLIIVPTLVGDAITKLDNHTFTVSTEGAFYESDLGFLLFALGILTVILVVGRMGWRYFSAHLGANIERDLRKKMFVHVETLPVSFYREKKVGGLLSYFTNDLQTIKTLFNQCIIWSTDLIVLGTMAFAMMFYMSYTITFICLVPLISFVVFGYFIGKEETRRYKAASDSYETLSDFTEENLQGFSVVKAFRKEIERRESFLSLSKDNEIKNYSYQKFSSLIDMGINMFLSVTYTLLLALGAYSIITLNPAVANRITDVGKLSSFMGYYGTLNWPMIAGGLLIDYISRGRGAYKRIESILDMKGEEDSKNAIMPSTDIQGDVEYRDFSFSYPDGGDSLKNCSFNVKKGMTVGIIGKTGSGKSTLLTVMEKFYPIEENRIFIDGKDIALYPRKYLREKISLVSQDSFLFSGELYKAVAFSENNPDQYDMEKVKDACRFASVDKDIELFQDGYSTILGEKGSTVSGGQRQRLCIARAIYKNPSILILDDSLSAVDSETEKEILDNIRNYRKGKTTFIIAHRISAIEDCDLILVMDKGTIIASGRHDELLSSCPLYKMIDDLQSLEKEVLG